MRPIRALLLLAALLFADAAAAQSVTSPGPDSVGVTIYRDPDREDAMELDWLDGYALITEQRRISIPAGVSVIRFEGVAEGMLPESAIVTGLPAGVREKNLDADLLSPRSLYAHGLGRRVTLRRTLDGKTVEESATIRSGPDGAAIVETREGFLAANCGNSTDSLVYDSVPPGLSAKPTLSVQTESAEAHQVTVTLSYLASGFDWDANYVATMRPGGKRADLFAWVTLASGDSTSFVDAAAAVVAGKPNREDDDSGIRPSAGPIVFRCFFVPLARPAVETIVAEDIGALPSASEGDIVVTGYRASMKSASPVMVVQEDLGDLKLYRVPHQTTVAAQSQKQVAMLDRKSVPVEILYRARDLWDEPRPAVIVLRAENRKEKGLGVPLPAGAVAVFEPHDGQPVLVGEGTLADRAVNEDAEVEVALSTQVFVQQEQRRDEHHPGDLVVTNANPHAIRFEASGEMKGSWTGARARRTTRQGRKLWVIDVPANGTVRFRYDRI